jgi:hypothetical protein
MTFATVSMTRVHRGFGAFIACAVVCSALALAATPDRADAYAGAPWFQPSTTYLDLSRPDQQNSNFPDPSIIRDGNTYYAYGATTGGAYLPIMSSTDLIHWTARPAYSGAPWGVSDPYFNDGLPQPASWGVNRNISGRLKKEVWAPGAAKIGGQYVVFHAVRVSTSQDRFCLSVSTSSSPLGPFVDNSSGPLVCDVQGDPNGSIDPQPFVDTDGTPWLIWKSEGVPGSQPTRTWSQQLNSSGTGFAPGSSPTSILETTAAWESDVTENPAMVRWNGRLFLFYSAGNWQSASYAIGYAECASPVGPCTKATQGGPLLASNGNRLGPGGPAPFVDASGRLMLGYHYWLSPYVGYPSDPNCDGNGQCTSQGQRRLAIDQVVLTGSGALAVVPFNQGGSCGSGTSSAPVAKGTFTPLTPSRVLDTRTGTGAARFPLGPGRAISVVVRGVGGVPASGVAAVALNVTATEATLGGFVTVHPTDVSRPDASNLNMVPGQTIPALVIAKVGPDGRACIYNDTGTTHVIADVVGWFADGASTGASLNALTPARVIDTRRNLGAPGPLGAGSIVSVKIAGQGGVPATGVSGVVLNVTTDRPTGTRSYVTVWPTGDPQPNASSLNMVTDETAPNLVFARLGADGQVSFFNETGTTHLVADVLGWFGTTPQANGNYTPLAPARVLDTRPSGPVGTNSFVNLRVVNAHGVPASGVSAVVLNVTATRPTTKTYITVWPAGDPRPDASNLNVVAGQSRPNLVIARVGANGQVSLYNEAGTTDLVVDVLGWFD